MKMKKFNTRHKSKNKDDTKKQKDLNNPDAPEASKPSKDSKELKQPKDLKAKGKVKTPKKIKAPNQHKKFKLPKILNLHKDPKDPKKPKVHKAKKHRKSRMSKRKKILIGGATVAATAVVITAIAVPLANMEKSLSGDKLKNARLNAESGIFRPTMTDAENHLIFENILHKTEYMKAEIGGATKQSEIDSILSNGNTYIDNENMLFESKVDAKKKLVPVTKIGEYANTEYNAITATINSGNDAIEAANTNDLIDRALVTWLAKVNLVNEAYDRKVAEEQRAEGVTNDAARVIATTTLGAAKTTAKAKSLPTKVEAAVGAVNTITTEFNAAKTLFDAAYVRIDASNTQNELEVRTGIMDQQIAAVTAANAKQTAANLVVLNAAKTVAEAKALPAKEVVFEGSANTVETEYNAAEALFNAAHARITAANSLTELKTQTDIMDQQIAAATAANARQATTNNIALANLRKAAFAKHLPTPVLLERGTMDLIHQKYSDATGEFSAEINKLVDASTIEEVQAIMAKMDALITSMNGYNRLQVAANKVQAAINEAKADDLLKVLTPLKTKGKAQVLPSKIGAENGSIDTITGEYAPILAAFNKDIEGLDEATTLIEVQRVLADIQTQIKAVNAANAKQVAANAAALSLLAEKAKAKASVLPKAFTYKTDLPLPELVEVKDQKVQDEFDKTYAMIDGAGNAAALKVIVDKLDKIITGITGSNLVEQQKQFVALGGPTT